MSAKPTAATVLTWLRGNGMSLVGVLTHRDTLALQAAVQVAELWVAGDRDSRELSAAAFGKVVEQMQPKARFLAFHAIAHAGDWSHRWELWMSAGLLAADVTSAPECKFGPNRPTAAAAPAA